MRHLAIALFLTLTACSKRPPPTAPAAPADASIAVPAVSTGPAFIEDDVAAAIAAAKASGKVVFVDAWAPWCHTCLSMQRDVLSTPTLAAFSDRVVFVAVDTDRPENNAFLLRFAVTLWPTFFVIDADEHLLAVHPGSMDLTETAAFVDAAIRSSREAAKEGPERELLDGHAAFVAGDVVGAFKHYETASSMAWARRTEAVLGGMRALSTSKDWAGCLGFGTAHLRDVERGGAPGDLATSVLSCAHRLGDEAIEARTRLLVRDRLLELVKNVPPGSAVDDRADVLATLADLQDELGDKAAAQATHTTRLKILEDDAAKATTPKQAQVHDYARLNSLLALGRGDEAVALFQHRVRQLPDDYEPWARLASTLFKLDRPALALPAVQQAIRLSYGTRRLRYRQLEADIAKKTNDIAAERAALQALLQDAATLPPALTDEALTAAARDRLAALPPV